MRFHSSIPGAKFHSCSHTMNTHLNCNESRLSNNVVIVGQGNTRNSRAASSVLLSATIDKEVLRARLLSIYTFAYTLGTHLVGYHVNKPMLRSGDS